MKIRYYLRGLGLGILVTAIFFMISGKSSQTMSDEMIKARAKELGMSESVVLSELPVKEETTLLEEEEMPEETITVVAETEETLVEESVAEESNEEVVEEVAEEVAIETEEEIAEEFTQAEPVTETEVQIAENTEPIVIVVNRGEGSDTVSGRLQEAGLVADAHEYDKYLMANGYDKRIGVGNHTIPAGATWEDIAKILCNMK